MKKKKCVVNLKRMLRRDAEKESAERQMKKRKGKKEERDREEKRLKEEKDAPIYATVWIFLLKYARIEVGEGIKYSSMFENLERKYNVQHGIEPSVYSK